MLYAKRERFSKISKKLGKIFSKVSPSPNFWTFSAILPAILTVYFLMKGEFLISAVLFALTAVVDLIDGAVAREMKRVTKFGAYLDTIVDRVVEFIILVGLFLSDFPEIILPTNLWILLMLFGSLMTTYVKAAAFEKKLVKKELKGGLLERGERLILIFFVIILAIFDQYLSSLLIVFIALAANVSAIQRFLIAIRK